MTGTATKGAALSAPYTGWAIVLEWRITRRKRFHYVLDPTGATRFSDRLLWPCMAFLDAEGVTEYALTRTAPGAAPGPAYIISRRELLTWQN